MGGSGNSSVQPFHVPVRISESTAGMGKGARTAGPEPPSRLALGAKLWGATGSEPRLRCQGTPGRDRQRPEEVAAGIWVLTDVELFDCSGALRF